jgi:hypothetical protein
MAHKIVPTAPFPDAQTVQLGPQGTAFNQSDLDKIVKLIGDSTYGLCATGDEIEGFIVAVEQATSGGYVIGGVSKYEQGEVAFVTANGLQATPGVGAIAVNDIVVASAQAAVNTKTPTSYPPVVKATTPANVLHKWRVVALSQTNSGAVGQRLTIERL